MGDICEICGDVGLANYIRICSKCKVSREHVYCRKPVGENPEVWLCEMCELGITASPKSEQKGIREPQNAEGPKWRKNSKPSKTKFLNPEDVIMLGARNFASSSQRFVPTTSGPHRPMASNLTSTILKPKPPTRIPSPNMGGNSERRCPRPSSPAFVRGNISSVNQQEIVSEKDLKGKKVFKVPRSEPNSGKETQSHSRKDKMVRKEAPCSLPPLVDHPPKMSSRKNICANASADIEREKRGAGNGKLVNALPEEKKVRGPARSSSWVGDFGVPGTGTIKDLNVAIEAHTPDLVRWKLLEFSKKLPEILSFELLPRPEVWTGIFQDYCPGKEDIGLYLFSRSSKRSEYVRLVEFMETSDLVLLTCVNGVDLLVFPSKCLSTDAQKWDGEHFLWGLFRCVKKKEAEQKARDKLPPPAQPSSVVHQNGETNTKDIPSDMEIDRMGRREVGIANIPPIPTAPISRNFTFLAQTPVLPSVIRIQEVADPTQPPLLPGVRRQEVVDIPQGFEEYSMNGASSQQR